MIHKVEEERDSTGLRTEHVKEWGPEWNRSRGTKKQHAVFCCKVYVIHDLEN